MIILFSDRVLDWESRILSKLDQVNQPNIFLNPMILRVGGNCYKDSEIRE